MMRVRTTAGLSERFDRIFNLLRGERLLFRQLRLFENLNILDISMIQLHLLPDLGLHRGLREARSFQGCDIPQDLKPELDKKPLLIELGEGSMRSIKGKCCYRAMRAAFDELPWPQKTRRHDGHYALSRACRWVIELTETPTLETGRSSREPYPTRGRVHTLGKEWRSTVAGLKNPLVSEVDANPTALVPPEAAVVLQAFAGDNGVALLHEIWAVCLVESA
ncbi:MAG: hypothetical protein LQ340_003707 [Diploschistes diacapsis]|nr:MAG: hypothetical protein LQ340_003707 [Diploschistes diacapsis]